MRSGLRNAVIALTFLGTASLSTAQELRPETVPDLRLSKEQKTTIYSSISNLKQREAEPPTFRAAVGAVVPPSVKLQPLPKTVAELMPQVKDLEYAMVANQVILVEPTSKKVMEVITE